VRYFTVRGSFAPVRFTRFQDRFWRNELGYVRPDPNLDYSAETLDYIVAVNNNIWRTQHDGYPAYRPDNSWRNQFRASPEVPNRILVPAPINFQYAEPCIDEAKLLRKTGKIGLHTVSCLGDTGAWNFVDYNWCKSSGISLVSLKRKYKVTLADGSHGKNVDFAARLSIAFGDKTTTDWFLVTHLAKDSPVTLGLPWFKRHLPDAVGAFVNFGHDASQRSSPQAHSSVSLPGFSYLAPMCQYEAVLAAGGGENQAAAAAIDAQINNIFSLQVAQLRQLTALVKQAGDSAPTTVVLPECFSDLADVFDLDYDKNPPKPLHGVEFRIDTIDNKLPPPATPFPLSPKDREIEEKEVKKLLKLGRIQPSSSPTAAPSFFVNKQCDFCHQLRCSCGHRAHPRRWVVDYRALNALTPQDAYPLPSIPELLSVAPGHKFYIKFDLDSAFHLVPVFPGHRSRTAFVSSLGLFEYLAMPFGAKNAPATFQRMIDAVLASVRHFCRAFMDDGIVWGDSIEELTDRFRQVLLLLRAAGLRVKLSKCEFFQPSVHFLGHIVSESGVSTDPAKLQAIIEWPEPRTKTDIRGFLGLTQYYREFYDNYSQDALPLTELTKNNAPDKFGSLPPDALAAFNKIKAYWSDPRNLAKYDPAKPVDLFTDASSEAWGGTVEQEGKPLAFGSGKFTPTERRWPTTDRELFACLQMHRRFGHLLQGKEVTWWTDHKALESYRKTLANNPRRVHWSDELNWFPFVVRYKKGKDMHVDGMTRHSSYAKDAGFGGTDPLLDPEKFPDQDISAPARTILAPPEGFSGSECDADGSHDLEYDSLFEITDC